jgi:hypothetical protein
MPMTFLEPAACIRDDPKRRLVDRMATKEAAHQDSFQPHGALTLASRPAGRGQPPRGTAELLLLQLNYRRGRRDSDPIATNKANQLTTSSRPRANSITGWRVGRRAAPPGRLLMDLRTSARCPSSAKRRSRNGTGSPPMRSGSSSLRWQSAGYRSLAARGRCAERPVI